LKKDSERAIIRVVIATGISSVVTQLLTIREVLTQFQGNEIVIALTLFNWLCLGGLGTFLARAITRRFWKATVIKLGWLSLALGGLSALQIPAIRELRDVIFIQGSSVGFYPTWLFSFLIITPYCLLLGFVLPYSLFVIRTGISDYPGTRIYITDNIGDISGGALFSFALVYLVTPLQAIFLANLPLLAAVYLLFPVSRRHRPAVLLMMALVVVILTGSVFREKASLAPAAGKLAYYRETRYGRIAVHQDREQFTLFEDGIPAFSSQSLSIAEETVHYPLSQLDRIEHVLLISAQGGVMAELQKYQLESIDYVELDPEVSAVQFRFGLIKAVPGLKVIHQDGRAYLAQTDKTYNAIIVNLPEPGTFQMNRFYTDRFFELAQKRLSKEGVLSFSMQGFDNYLAEPHRQKLSSLYNTIQMYFKHILMLPGQKVFFLCRNRPLITDIPAALAHKGISSTYINGFYYGNLTPERIDRLNARMDPTTPINVDTSPYFMRLMFSQWFAKFQTSPIGFFLVLSVLSAIYFFRITREEFVLFSTGCMTMGSEILVIFAFQIYFGYIYLQIGIIITVFLAGLLPGAWLGNRLHRKGKPLLVLTDGLLIVFLALFILSIDSFSDRLPVSFYLVFGFAVSLTCGFQFPLALYLIGNDNAAVTRTFSADLIGAAGGTLFTSAVLIPYAGILWTAAGLIGLKLISLLMIAPYKTTGIRTQS
jgi:spermidine synthase